MSQKITAKNLTYNSSLPPFLARLHGHRSAQTGPDPILATHRRPGQKRSASEEAEDSPLVVDENGNIVDLGDSSLREGAVREEGEENKGAECTTPDEKDDSAEDKAQGKEKEKTAGIGTTRKRKVGRVIGEEQSDGEGKANTRKQTADDAEARFAKASADVRRLVRGVDAEDSTDTNARKGTKITDDQSGKDRKPQDGPQHKSIKSAKKRVAKKIKLSFGDNDEGD